MIRALLLAPLLLSPALALARPDYEGRATAASAKSFAAEVALLDRLVACREGTPQPPEGIDGDRVRAYCESLANSIDRFRRYDQLIAKSFFEGLHPNDAPSFVVYPFGTGDLAYPLMVYRDAREVVTLSPEPAGDPRSGLGTSSPRFGPSMARLGELALRLLETGRTMPLGFSSVDANGIAPQLSLFLLGLAVHGYRPVDLKYFRIEEDGSLRYLDEADFERCADQQRSRRPCDAFASSELSFIHELDPPDTKPRIHRHLSAALADDRLKHSAVLRWLGGKGKMSALAKGAGYQLWQPSHSALREYLLGHMRVMISDSSGVPPRLARRAGFALQPFGHYFGTENAVNADYDRQLISLYSSAATKTLLLRFGNTDRRDLMNLLVTRTATPGISFAQFEGISGGERVDVFDEVLGGKHWRLWTDSGAVHVWTPPGYRPETAGTVIYVHGYYVNADEAWTEHRLAEQFLASRRNAIFIVPEACSSDQEPAFWEDLESLEETVYRLTRMRRAAGPLVAVAHSGGFRTVIEWLESPRVAKLVFLDAMYGKPFMPVRAWLRGDRSGRSRTMVMTSTETVERSELLARSIERSRTIEELPEEVAALAPEDRKAQLLYFVSQYGHMEMITNGKVIPFVLELGPIPALAPADSLGHRR